ncbi:MAG: sulfatase [Planctomycetaceae bacterium]
MQRILVFLACLICPSILRAEAPPNVVLIISDDQGWRDYSFMGHPAIQTPHIDRLASESLVYTRGYVPDSLCRPSLASMLTGQFPHRHGITGNDPVLTPELAKLPRGKAQQTPEYAQLRTRYSENIDEFPKLPGVLHDHLGYVSLQTGKWWERRYSAGGFSHGMSHGVTGSGGRHGDEGLAIGRDGLQPVEDFIDEATRNQKPFFVWYAPMLPHTPHNPPQRILDKYLSKTPHVPIAKYWAMCEWFDETVGDLLTVLEKRDLTRNTIVIYITDNGWIQNPKGGEATGAERAKRSQYDGGVRTPLMIRWPGHVEPRRDETHLASSLDLFPTITAAVGIEDPALRASLPGVNLLDEQQVADRKHVFGEIFEHDVYDIARPAASLKYRWVNDGQWKLIIPHAERVPDGAVELYHITEDPDELKNLAASEPDRVASLREVLDAWWKPE